MVDRPRAWRSPPPIPQPIPGVIPTRPRDVMPAIPPPPLVPSGPYREPAGESLETRVERIEKMIAEARRGAWRINVTIVASSAVGTLVGTLIWFWCFR